MVKALIYFCVACALASCAVVRLDGTGFAAGLTCAQIENSDSKASACAFQNSQSAPVVAQ